MGESRDGQDEMHRQVEWMTRSDVTILEYLHSARDTKGNPALQQPSTIAKNTGHHPKTAGKRCRELVDHDLVERPERGWYRLSEKGEKLMSGEIRPEDL